MEMHAQAQTSSRSSPFLLSAHVCVSSDSSPIALFPCSPRSLPRVQVHEHLLRVHGQQTTHTAETRAAIREVGRSSRLVHGHEHTIRAASRVYTAFDVQSKRAKQRASVLLLRDAHPDACTWQDMMDRYPTEGADAKPRLAPRSQVAEHLLRTNTYEPVSKAMRSKEQRLSERAVQLEPSAAVGGGSDSGGASSSSSVLASRAAVSPVSANYAVPPPHYATETSKAKADGPMEGTARSIPGQGSHFAYAWQRQFDLEHARRAVLSDPRARIENDTLFAFAFDAERERADESKLAGLRRAVRRLERVELSEALRASEPVSIQMGATAESDRGVEQLREEEEDEDGGEEGEQPHARDSSCGSDHVDTRPAKRHAAAAMSGENGRPNPTVGGSTAEVRSEAASSQSGTQHGPPRSRPVPRSCALAWEPWKAGTRTHARLMEIAQMSAKQG